VARKRRTGTSTKVALAKFARERVSMEGGK